MKSLFTKASFRSNLRHVYVGLAFVYAAAQTYLATGNSIGWNKETLIGLGAQVGIALSALAAKYFDTTDPVMGKVADAVLEAVDTKLEPLTKPDPKPQSAPKKGLAAP
jgi:hypothetical protein